MRIEGREVYDSDVFHPLPSEWGVEVYRTQVGSGIHGVTIKDHDDRDEMGICIERPSFLLGLGSFEQWIYRTQPEGVRSGKGDLDLTVYSLRKWTKLAMAGNPTVLMPLFVPDSEVVVDSDVGRGLRNKPERFLSRRVADRFLGYMVAQRERMLGLRGKRTNRPELVAEFGYDTKFAYHMLRLGIQGIELLDTGRITLPMPRQDREYLLRVRRGEVSKVDVLHMSGQLEKLLREQGESADLPPAPDYSAINRWLIETYQRTWAHSYPKWMRDERR